MKAISFQPNFEQWQSAARKALIEEIRPEQLLWCAAGEREGELYLFGTHDAGPFPVSDSEVEETAASGSRLFTVPRRFLELAKVAVLHSSAERWPMLYRILWRLTHAERRLLEIPTDSDVIGLNHFVREVQKDAYRMQQFVRFRETRLENQRWFVAWYEPEHDSVHLNEKFCVDRFTNMRWSILTPKRCMHWNGESVTHSPGVAKSSAPLNDDVESLWVTYYSNIFNPARVKVRAMKAQMPVRNWKNLPETNAISTLLVEAPTRVEEMLQRSDLQCMENHKRSRTNQPQTRDKKF